LEKRLVAQAPRLCAQARGLCHQRFFLVEIFLREMQERIMVEVYLSGLLYFYLRHPPGQGFQCGLGVENLRGDIHRPSPGNDAQFFI